MISRLILLSLAAALAGLPQSARACSVCFGDPNSPVAQGVVMGVLVLLSVVLAVLGGFTAFGIYMARRSAAASANPVSTEPAKPV
ncbi:MAG: hypothetical protein L0Y58_25775 [Verrucomicrobia subdivision 3 bacterium]|nr:hypothetical protein [Limisphaerales bacterium]